jgi:osmotically inducible protein OsmC
MESRANAIWEGDLLSGSGSTSLASGVAGPLPVSWASRTEAAAGKTSPEELIAAAHAGNPPRRLSTSAAATFEKTDAGWRLTTMALAVKGDVPGVSASDFADHAVAAKDDCPVSNALKGNVEISVEAGLA